VSLSIVLCTYQGARWLPDLLRSLAQQDHLPDELVVRDDASTDQTREILQAFRATAPFEVRLTVNPTRLGSTRNFAQALADARGRVVALADQDDLWYPTKLASITAELDLDPTISMVFSDADLIDEAGNPIGERLWDARLVGRTLRRHVVVPEELLARRALTTGCTMAVRRRVIEAALPFPDVLDDPRALMRHDRWLSLVAAAVGTVRALPDQLLGFRVHPSQETGVLVGDRLQAALATAARAVGRERGAGEAHLVRAEQLCIAADRAQQVGDFKEAENLRTVADHHRDRGSLGLPGHGVLTLLRRVLAGTYRGDPFAPAAVAADLARTLSPAHRAPPAP
jgi:hypothetical protein